MLTFAQSQDSIPLFNGKDLSNWTWHDAGGSGPAEVKDQQILLQTGDSLSGIIYKDAEKLSWKHYEITLEAQRLEGFDFFCGLTFPVGSVKTSASLIMGGWGGSVTGISSINGMDAAENATGHYRPYKDHQWYKIRLLVTPKILKVWIDGEEAIIADIENQKIGVRSGPIEEYVPLSLTTFQTTAAFRNIHYKNLEKKESPKAP